MQQTTPARGLVALLIIFLLAQTLGWMHRGLHGIDEEVVQSAASTSLFSVPSAAPTNGASDDRSWVDSLFANHEDASDCRLFDAVAQPGCTPATSSVESVTPGSELPASTHDDFIARWSALFDARGPPPSR